LGNLSESFPIPRRVCHTFVRETFQNHQSLLDIFQPLVTKTMLGTSGSQLQVGDAVVAPHPIEMMNNLLGVQEAAKMVLHHEAMLVDGAVVARTWMTLGGSDEDVASYFLAEVQRPSTSG
jgi:hypothetical protein